MNMGWLSKSDGVCTVCCDSALSPAVSDRLKDGLRNIRTKFEALSVLAACWHLYNCKRIQLPEAFRKE